MHIKDLASPDNRSWTLICYANEKLQFIRKNYETPIDIDDFPVIVTRPADIPILFHIELNMMLIKDKREGMHETAN